MRIYDTLEEASVVNIAEERHLYVRETEKFYKIKKREDVVRRAEPHALSSYLLEETDQALKDFFTTDASKVRFDDTVGRHLMTEPVTDEPEDKAAFLLKQDLTKENVFINAVEIDYGTENLDGLLETRHYSANNANSSNHANSPEITGGAGRILIKVQRLPAIGTRRFVRQEIHKAEAAATTLSLSFFHRVLELNTNGTVRFKSPWVEATIGEDALDLAGSANYVDVGTSTASVNAGTNLMLGINNVPKGKYLMVGEFPVRAQGTTAGTITLRPTLATNEIPIDDDATIAVTYELTPNSSSSWVDYSPAHYHGLLTVPNVGGTLVRLHAEISVAYRYNSDINARPKLFLYHLPDFS